jgi:hypothetical protein
MLCIWRRARVVGKGDFWSQDDLDLSSCLSILCHMTLARFCYC